LVQIEDLSLTKQKILNYLLAFKYNNNDLENTYHYLNALKHLSDLPIFYLPKNTIEAVDEKEKEFVVNTINVFGKPTYHNLTVNFKIFSTENTLWEGIVNLKNSNSFSINTTSKFTKPGKYYISLAAGENKIIRIKNEVVAPKETPKVAEKEDSNNLDLDLPDNTNLTDNSNSTVQNEANSEEPKETYTEKTVFQTSFSNTLKFHVTYRIKLNHLLCSITNSGSKESQDLKEL